MSKNSTMHLLVGNDNGNSEHDIIIDGVLIQQPNVYSRLRTLPNLDELKPEHVAKHIHDKLITTIASPLINNGAPTSFAIGYNATKSGHMLKNIEVGAENSKITSDVPIINTLSQIAGYCAAKSYQNSGVFAPAVTCHVDMVTALPVNQFTKDSAKAFAALFMDHVHTVTVHMGTEQTTVKLIFDYVKVLPESVPVVFYLQQLSSQDEIFNEFKAHYSFDFDQNYFVDKKILHVAIGEGTTEYPVTHDINFDPHFIKGTNNGVGHAIEAIISEFIQAKKLVKFQRQDFSMVLRDKNHKYYDDALDLIDIPLEDQADVILNTAKHEVGRANNDIDIICVHGGGSILMKDHLHTKLLQFGKSTDIKVFYVPTHAAVTLEVNGLYAFGQSEIFKSLKSKKMGQSE